MVAETMIMGGRIASKFSHENNIHIPFRTQVWNPSASFADIKLREELLDCRSSNTGMIKMEDMVKYMSILPPSSVTTQPGLPHVVMGITDGYTRATSPLRRFLDVVVHWQLKSHLLGKKKSPFSLAHLNTLSKQIETREKQISILQQRSIQFWVISLLDRMRVDGFTDTMEWNCIVSMPNRSGSTELGGAMEVATGTLLELGIRGRIIKLNRTLQTGEVVKVRVSGLDALLGRIDLELI
jgi:exoribonuclease R